MKLNLTISGLARNGWMNVDPLTQPNDQSKIAHNLDNLDEYVDNNECEEVVALEVLDIFPVQMKQQVLNHWSAKVAHGGTLTFSGVDLDKIAKIAFSKQVDSNQVNRLLYGECNNMWTIKKGLLTTQQACELALTSGQFKILSKEISGINYIIKAERL